MLLDSAHVKKWTPSGEPGNRAVKQEVFLFAQRKRPKRAGSGSL
jgi:hypothetical protein